MDLRARIMASMKQAMKEKDAERLSTVRLISAAIKDRDIAARADGNDDGVDEINEIDDVDDAAGQTWRRLRQKTGMPGKIAAINYIRMSSRFRYVAGGS